MNSAGLAAGTYNGSVSIASTGAAKSPQTVPLTLTVSSPGGEGTLAAMPRYLRFTSSINGSAPHPQTLHVTSSSGSHGFTASRSAPRG